MANFGQFFTGAPGKVEQVSRFSPDIQKQLQPLLMQALQGLGGDQSQLTRGFQPIKQNALRTFNQDIVPSLAERFTSTGGGHDLSSSGAFASQLGSASSDLASMLGAQEAQYGQNEKQSLMQLLGLGQMENIPLAGQSGILEKIFPGLFDLLSKAGIGVAGGALAGGPGGRLAGAGSGLMASLFGNKDDYKGAMNSWR